MKRTDLKQCEEQIVDLYKRKWSQKEIADELGASQQGIGKVLARKNILIRKEKSLCNSTYFDTINSEEKAYWLGFLAADGWISTKKQIGVSLHISDKAHIVKFCAAVFPGAEVKVRRNTEAYVLFKSAHMVESLQKYGFTTQKSEEFTPVVPKGYEKDFWRGMIDGDGSLCATKNGYWSLSLIGTKQTATTFKKFCVANGVKTGDFHKNKECHVYTVWGVNAKKIMATLYEGATIALDRKKEIAKKKMLTSSQEGCLDIGQSMAKEFLQKNHYLQTLPIGLRCYGWFRKGKLIGVAAIGSTSSPALEKKYKGRAIELRRFALSLNEKNLASKFLAAVVRDVKIFYEGRKDILLSFADGAQGHEGTIYKAIGATEVSRSGKQIVGKTKDGALLTGVHLQRYVKENGIYDLQFEESSGKICYSIALV